MGSAYVYEIRYYYTVGHVSEREEVGVHYDTYDVASIEISMENEESKAFLRITAVLPQGFIEKKNWAIRDIKTLIRAFILTTRLRTYVIPGYTPDRDEILIYDAKALIKAISKTTGTKIEEIHDTESHGTGGDIIAKAYLKIPEAA